MRAGESIFIDFQKSGVVLDADMHALYELQNSSDVVQFSGACGKSIDDTTFEMRIAGADTEGLADGTYTLLVKVYNDISGYVDYIYEESIKIRS